MGTGTAPWPRAIAVGDALMDTQYWVPRMPAPGQDVEILAREENAGGSAANTAMGMAWLGVPCAFCGALGQDDIGERIEAMLHRVGVDTRLVRRTGSTGYVLSMIDATGERTMFSWRGASAQTQAPPLMGEALAHARVVLLSGYMLADEEQAPFALALAGQARQAGAKVALDASPKFGGLPQGLRQQALAVCDIFLPNREELAAAGPGGWEENLEALARQLPCVAAKLGGQGAVLRAAPGFWPAPGGGQGPAVSLAVPTQSVTPVDTTGAGDAFNAGFLAAYLRGAPPRECLEAGNQLAGRVIATRGATGLYKTANT